MPEEWTWVFERPGDRLAISRSTEPGTRILTISGDLTSRTLSFPTHQHLVRFQTEFEQHLLDAGWQFTAFTPERRTRDNDPGRCAASDRRLLPFRARS